MEEVIKECESVGFHQSVFLWETDPVFASIFSLREVGISLVVDQLQNITSSSS